MKESKKSNLEKNTNSNDKTEAIWVSGIMIALAIVIAGTFESLPSDGVPRNESGESLVGNDGQTMAVSYRGGDIEITPFNEFLTGNKHNKFNFKSINSPSRLRDQLNYSGVGANVSNSDGEVLLSSGTSSNGYAQIRTRERGQYIAGTAGEAGIGVRIPNLPTGNQFIEWGYFDNNNGFGFGVNSQCTYVFIKDDGVKESICQENWNIDKMDGTGKSNHNLSLSVGHIFQNDFVHYGYGSIEYVINADAGNNMTTRRVNHNVHRINRDGSTSIDDPNQPLNVIVNNNGTSSNLDVYIGGRQFSVVGADYIEPSRPVSANLESYTITGAQTWRPLIAIRKKSIHPVTGGTNSINAMFQEFSTEGVSEDLELKVTYDGDITGGTFNSPESWGAESAIEVTKVTDGLSVNSSDEGLIIARDYIEAGGVGPLSEEFGDIRRSRSIIIGIDAPVIIWGRKATATDVNIETVVINWKESW